MKLRKAPIHFLWQPIAGFVLFLCTTAETGFRHDELECEQAAKKLTECCSGFEPTSFSCAYSGDCLSTTYPWLSIDDSKCIESSDCGSLQSKGVCEKAIELHTMPPHDTDASSVETVDPPSARICQ